MTHPLLDLPVHPAAAVFPMLTDDELADLAEDIKANGLLHPVVLDEDGQLVDGRNRYVACRIAGVTPACIQFGGDDVVAFIVSENLQRRHLTVGQRAIAVVRMDCRNFYSLRKLASMAGVDPMSISHARTVVDLASDLAEQVMTGASLHGAYTAAVERKQADLERDRAALDSDTRRTEMLAALERERRALLDELRTVRDEIGPPVTIPPEPELEIRIETQDDAERLAVPSADLDVAALDAQRRLHAQCRKIKADLIAIGTVDVDPNSPMFEGLVMSVRSWASQVVTHTYDIVERYNAALENQTQLRRVK